MPKDHGLGFESGCDSTLESAQTGQSVPDDDATCWEIHSFGVGADAYEEEEGLSEEEVGGIMVVVVIVLCLVGLLCIGAVCWWRRNMKAEDIKIREAIQGSQAVPTGTGAEEAEPTGPEIGVEMRTDEDVAKEKIIATSTTQD